MTAAGKVLKTAFDEQGQSLIQDVHLMLQGNLATCSQSPHLLSIDFSILEMQRGGCHQ